MKKMLKNVLSIVLVLGLVMGSVGCSTSSETEVESGSKAAVSEEKKESSSSEESSSDKVKLSLMIHANGNLSFAENNKIETMLEEKLNIELEPEVVMIEDLASRRNMVLASGELPDILALHSMGDETAGFVNAKEFAESGVLVPLDELLEEYGTHILDKYPEESLAPYRVDGKLYALPAQQPWSTCFGLRKDWLDTLGIDMATFDEYTYDDLYDVLYKFTYEDPDGNGEDDTYGLVLGSATWTYDFLLGAYGYRTSELYEKDGMLIPGALMPEIKEVATFVRRLLKDGLVDSEFALTDDKLVRQKYESGKYGALYHNVPLFIEWHGNYRGLLSTTPEAEMVDINPPSGPEGKRGILKGSPLSNLSVFGITTNCEDPARAIELLDYICSDEGLLLTKYGEEGVDYNIVDGVVKQTDIALEPGYNAENGIVEFFTMLLNPTPTISQADDAEKELRQRNVDRGIIGIQLAQVPASQSEYGQTLNDIMSEYIIRLMASDEDIDTLYDEFVKAYMENGGEIIGKERYEIYQSIN